jgi:DNA modification methylase
VDLPVSYTLVHAGAIPALSTLPSGSAHALCTSVPYWRQRAYKGKGAYGQEVTREEWAENQVAVFHEARRVLRDDATAFVVVGEITTTRITDNLMPGEVSLQGPWLAERFRDDGWHVKSLVIIEFTNRPPRERLWGPVQAHEYGILLSKSEKNFFWDHLSSRERGVAHDRLLRSVWTGQVQAAWQSKRSKFKHGSTYPKWIVERYLAGAVSQGGVCANCGAPRRPIIQEARGGSKGKGSWHPHKNDAVHGNAKTVSSAGYEPAKITGWLQGCDCGAADARPLVLDPYAGTSTTGVVAMTKDCDYWGCDIDRRCIAASTERLEEHAETLKTPLFDSEKAARRQSSLPFATEAAQP